MRCFPSKAQRGVALVITLIMLAAVTVMAVVFLGLSRRERVSIAVTDDLTDAKLMADAALARAQAEVVARIAAQSNLLAYDFLVSTNFINSAGFQSGQSSPLNVNYFYDALETPLDLPDLLQNLTNLYYDPRPPVFIQTNRDARVKKDFRFFLDINRNGWFETNGLIRTWTNGVEALPQFWWGDPEWVGVLERPDLPHSASNKFIGRFAFIVLPAGKSLDLNYVHNAVKRGALPDYLRNQGYGSWEINLAAFLESLMPEAYVLQPYGYSPVGLNFGLAFEDARDILSYRYGPNPEALGFTTANQALFGALEFARDGIDNYSDGPLLTDLDPFVETAANGDDPNLPLWPGFANPRGYVSHQEWFDPTKVPPGLTNRLQQAIQTPINLDTGYRYTFTRLLSQMSMDSPAANEGKLHLNYDNVSVVNGVTLAPTNFVPWTNRLAFFTNAANRLLKRQYGSDLDDGIRIYPTNQYSAGVHRLLQLSANVLDATTPSFAPDGKRVFPSVFRPVFYRRGTNVFIRDYLEVTNDAFLAYQWVSLANNTNVLTRPGADDGAYPYLNVYGIPMVVGAVKGLPNFNEFYFQTSAQVSRRVEALKRIEGARPEFRQVYEVGVSNHVGLEAWNSYTQAFPRALELHLRHESTAGLYDLRRPVGDRALVSRMVTNQPPHQLILADAWKDREFRVPLTNLTVLQPEVEYYPQLSPAENAFKPVRTMLGPTTKPLGFPVLDLKLEITNRLWFALIDQATRRVMDYATFDNLWSGIDIGANLMSQTNEFANTGGIDPGSFWRTNLVDGGPLFANQLVPEGLLQQFYVSTNDVGDDIWQSYGEGFKVQQSKENAIDGFRHFLGYPMLFNNPGYVPPPTRWLQVPFTPYRAMHVQYSWQADDPIVHYQLEDIYDEHYAGPDRIEPLQESNLGKINQRYRPWGGRPGSAGDEWATELGAKDPLVRQSDDWDFPTNKLPTLGWLGRVHRGTPWQTFYLKSTVVDPRGWLKRYNRLETHPTNDWGLIDLFTVAPNEAAARGLLGVNQTNLAAWSAVLSGVQVVTNSTANPTNVDTVVVEPRSPQLTAIVQSINQSRMQQPFQTYRRMGHVLAAPALTVESPYLDHTRSESLSDAAYEWIPQQILSLLREDEPYLVVYAYGQSLKPADRSIYTMPGPYQGLCTNYQITSEVLVKAAVRISEQKGDGQTRPNTYRAAVQSYNVLPSD